VAVGLRVTVTTAATYVELVGCKLEHLYFWVTSSRAIFASFIYWSVFLILKKNYFVYFLVSRKTVTALSCVRRPDICGLEIIRSNLLSFEISKQKKNQRLERKFRR
jgi:hypothetical protein